MNQADPESPESTDAEVGSESSNSPKDHAVAPGVPRLAAPPGASAEPPVPSIVATLPASAGGGASYVDRRHPSFLFLAVVSILSLAADIGTKLWAEKRLDGYPNSIPVWKEHLAFVLAKNKGGAWGLLQGSPESVRRPFFLLVSVAAIAFIVTLYRKLLPRQHALKWGLPLVLGGALGNVFDRIRYGYVIDFVDAHFLYKGSTEATKAPWRAIVDFIDAHLLSKGHDYHWPTFNVADIAICVGVGLMAVDMFTARRSAPPQERVKDPEPHALPQDVSEALPPAPSDT